MGNLLAEAIANVVNPQMRSASPPSGWSSFFPFGKLTEAGKNVNSHSALTISAFYCAVNTIADSIALLPMSVYKKEGKTREHFESHPANYLLYREPNSYMTAFVFKHIMAVSLLMRGNAYAFIERGNDGNIKAYRYINPDDVRVIEHNGKLFYKIKGHTFSANEIIHIPGFSFDGVTGKSILEHAADNLGVSLSAQKFGSDSLQDRGVSQGVIETEKVVEAQAKRRISDAWTAALTSGNKHRAAVLDEGFKYKPITLSPQEAQFIETYASGIADIARWFRVPLHKLHTPGEGGYNFLVQMSIEYLQTAVMPLGEKFKQEFERKSFTAPERVAGVYINLNYKKLLQADPSARAQFYKDMIFVKAITPNEIRELEDLNPYEGGDEVLQMSNLLNEQQLEKMLKDGKAE